VLTDSAGRFEQTCSNPAGLVCSGLFGKGSTNLVLELEQVDYCSCFKRLSTTI